MPQGDEDKYTDKQKRKAEHIEEGYENRGAPRTKQRAALGRPSIGRAEAVTNPAMAEASLIPTSPRKQAVRRAAKHLRTERSLIAPLQPRRRLRRENITASKTDGAAARAAP